MNEKSINYYPTKSKLVFVDSLYPSDYGMFEGKPFTGIKETITVKEYIREIFVNRKLHGIQFNKSEKFFSIIVYIFNESRYTFQIYKRDPKTSNFEIYTAYQGKRF